MKRPSASKQVRRWEAEFHFVNDCVLKGEVDVLEGEMRLTIEGGATPYLIKGKQWNNWYEGKNSAPGGAYVDAQWAQVKDRYLGFWMEDSEFVFWFQLLRKKSTLF